MVDNLKPVDVMHMLEQIKTIAITWTDRRFVESYNCIYTKVQEMPISGRIQTSIDKSFKWVFIKSGLM